MRYFLILLVINVIISGCAKKPQDLTPMNGPYPDCRFGVISDIHYFDASLGDTGAMFNDYINNDRKMLSQSKFILDYALASLRAESLDFILIPGDLTKDGEDINHRILSRLLSVLDNVYVIPGNHDINNPHAFSYALNEYVPSVTPQQFIEIYSDMGYSKPISRDSASLSYIAEPVEGLILIALDCCKYDNNEEYPETSGYIKHQTVQWMTNALNEYRDKSAICIMHHPVSEHFKGMKKHYPEYVLDNSELLTDIFTSLNVKLVFTGHFHANDITAIEKSGNTVYDIETGSILTYPSPFRIVHIMDNEAHIRTYYVDSISAINDFPSYAQAYIRSGIVHIAEKRLKSFGVNQPDIENLTGLIADAFIAHYRGDEESFKIIDYSKLSVKGKAIAFFQRGLVENLVHDRYPEDNNVKLDLH